MKSTAFLCLAFCSVTICAQAQSSADRTSLTGWCSGQKEEIVTAIAARYGAILQWGGTKAILGVPSGGTLELYTSSKGWAIVSSTNVGKSHRVCVVDAGAIHQAKPRTVFECDHDPSINALVVAAGSMRPAYWARSDTSARAYVLYAEANGPSAKWALRGASSTLLPVELASAAERCTTLTGVDSTTYRSF